MTADENILCEHVVKGGSVKIRAYGNYFIWAYRGESEKMTDGNYFIWSCRDDSGIKSAEVTFSYENAGVKWKNYCRWQIFL